MVHPDTELRLVNSTIGWGVFAVRAIPRGTIVWALDELDQRISPNRVSRLPPYAREVLDKYSYRDRHGDHVLCWDHARFFNHSCAANCLSLGYDFELAVRDIAAGEELTDDYATLNLSEPFSCSCGHPACRKRIVPDDHVRLRARWDDLGRSAFFCIPNVPQPLWSVVVEQHEVQAALADHRLLRSIEHQLAPPHARATG